MRRALIAGTGLLCGLLCGSCRTVSVCEYDFARCGELEIIADRDNIKLYQGADHMLKVSFRNRFSDVAIDCFLETEDHSSSPKRVATLAPAASDVWQEIIFSRVDLQTMAMGRYALLCAEVDGARRPARLKNILLQKSIINYRAPTIISYPRTEDSQPIVEQIGFIGNSVIVFSSGTDKSGAVQVKKFRVYSYGVPAGSLDELPDKGYFANSFPKETLAAFSKSDIYLLTPWMAKLPLRRCAGVMPASVAECPIVDNDSKAAIEANKALVITADGGWAARADPSGNLWQVETQAPLKWEAVMTTAMVSKAVKVASGDLNADGKADLVAIWQEGSSQQARVFLGRADGFGEDQVWSKMLQDGLGGRKVTALAVGDVDADGCADVVVGAGLELAIVQNQQDRFVPTWTQRIDPSSGVTEIAAVAVGRLTGSVPNQNLDVVAAGNTPYDEPMPPEVPMSKLYLHAFRPQ